MKIILFFSIFLNFNTIFSQQTDSLIFNNNIEYNQKFIDSLMLIKNRKKVLSIEDFAKMLRSNDSLQGWVHYYEAKSSSFYRKKDFDSSIFYANTGIKFFNKSKTKRPFDEERLTKVYIVKGASLMELGNYKKSIISYQTALDLIKKYPYKWKSYIITGIANNHFRLGNDGLALKYSLLASKDNLYMSIDQAAIVNYTRIGSLYSAIGNNKSAIQSFNKGLKRAINSNYKTNISTIYGSLGNIYESKKKPDSVIYYYKKAIHADDTYGISNYKGALEENEFRNSYIAIFEGSLNEAIINLKKLIHKINSFEKINKDDKDLIIKSIETLGIAYQAKGDSNEYQNLLKESFNFLDRFHKEQLNENIQNIETQYQTKEKEASILQLSKIKEQQSVIINQQKIIGLSLGGLFFIITIAGGLFWRQLKLKNKYLRDNLEQRLLLAQMNPHFIGNAMNVISSLVNKKSKNTIPYINRLSNLFRLVLTNSREEFISLEEEILILKSYLEIQSNFSKNFDFSFSIDEELDIEEVLIPPMLIQPFIENSILHGFSNNDSRGIIKVFISKKEKEKLLYFKIMDNGVGYKYNNGFVYGKKQKSVSVDIIKERLEILKKKFKVKAQVFIKEEDKGTSVELYLPFLIDI